MYFSAYQPRACLCLLDFFGRPVLSGGAFLLVCVSLLLGSALTVLSPLLAFSFVQYSYSLFLLNTVYMYSIASLYSKSYF